MVSFGLCREYEAAIASPAMLTIWLRLPASKSVITGVQAHSVSRGYQPSACNRKRLKNIHGASVQETSWRWRSHADAGKPSSRADPCRRIIISLPLAHGLLFANFAGKVEVVNKFQTSNWTCLLLWLCSVCLDLAMISSNAPRILTRWTLCDRHDSKGRNPMRADR